jgi:hypothetical protein
MAGKSTIWAVAAAVIAGSILLATPSFAEFFGCNDHSQGRVLAYYRTPSATHEFAAQTTRPRIVVHPRRKYVGRNSVRQCRSALVKEYRVSGPVIVPRMRCWWD